MDQHEKYWPLVIGATFRGATIPGKSVIRKAKKARRFALSLMVDVSVNNTMATFTFEQSSWTSAQTSRSLTRGFLAIRALFFVFARDDQAARYQQGTSIDWIVREFWRDLATAASTILGILKLRWCVRFLREANNIVINQTPSMPRISQIRKC